jgi:hypothetical protein
MSNCKKVLAVCIALWPLAASADDLVISGLSTHFHNVCQYQTCDSLNGVNPGLSYRKTITEAVDIQAGFYKNSFSRLSVYAVGEYSLNLTPSVKLGVFAGAASNYPVKYNHNPDSLSYGVVPIGGLFTRVQIESVNITARIVPPVNSKTVGVVSLEFGYTF